MINKSTIHKFSKKSTDDIDRSIGSKLKNRRIMLGMTQRELGQGVDITPQQIQKYESGINRVSASTLYVLAQHLKTSVARFFLEDIIDYNASIQSNTTYNLAEEQEEFESFNLNTNDNKSSISEKEIIKLVSAYNKINNSDMRKKVSEFVEEIASYTRV